ncbi:aminotransferase class I/II-fold pyridoxal phosphate-dependent enzyme [Legionella spiritensis]|uniref:aminotransferase class I/II-fold pyridoxal phosphate-dependent enzyme n=1 Tax=Legionella spiritensis TaxID=452 RepID=UPI000F6DBC1F|nr:aminotransferase class I/II-fold pyridoxal phosphate-dependent enzyme [Legionella spiritensis]VEG90105.1 8-amino-7-oxononanoate synthase [Legionella spiritensis]
MNKREDILAAKIKALHDQGLHRKRGVTSEPGMVNFSSNDYLSLATEEKIKRAYREGYAKYPSGSGGSPVICGYHRIHRDFEQDIARALQVDDAILFSSGYAANLGLMAVLAQTGAHLILDKGSHASFYDGIKLAQVPYTRYANNNMITLAQKLKCAPSNPIIITEGVFSMGGQQAPLNDILMLGKPYDALCMVDEAHSFGLIGDHGLGLVQRYRLSQEDIPLRIIPFGKAFAGQGAVIAGHQVWIDALTQYARSYIYSTTISPALTYGLRHSFYFLYDADDRRRKLQDLVRYFSEQVRLSPLKWCRSKTAIQYLILGCPYLAVKYAQLLQAKSIVCQAVRVPTVSAQQTGLRVVLNYHHDQKDIDYLFRQLHVIHDATFTN